MSERDEPQISFRLKEQDDKDDFTEALKGQRHIPSAAAFFQSTMKALKDATDSGTLIEWPVELVTKPKKRPHKPK